jgi:hypothetical protein
MLPFSVPVIFTFEIQDVLKLKKNSGAKWLRASTRFEHYLLIIRRRYTNVTWYIVCVLCQLAAPGLKWNRCLRYTVHHVGFIILIYYDAWSLYWYTMMHGHYTDILRCTVTILIYYDARSLYWYTMMHGHYTDILCCTVTVLIYYAARSQNIMHLELQCSWVILSSNFFLNEFLYHVKYDRYWSWCHSIWKEWLYTTTCGLTERIGIPWLIIICRKWGNLQIIVNTHTKEYQSEIEGLINSFNRLSQGLWQEVCHVVSNMGINPTNCLSPVAKWQLNRK